MVPKDKKFFIGVKALITNPKGEVLLLKARPYKPSHKFKEYWDLPGGKMTSNNIRDTLLREIREETGIDSIKLGVLFGVTVSNIRINNNKDELFYVVYRCLLDSKPKVQLSIEHREYKWASPEDAREMLRSIFPKDFLQRL